MRTRRVLLFLAVIAVAFLCRGVAYAETDLEISDDALVDRAHKRMEKIYEEDEFHYIAPEVEDEEGFVFDNSWILQKLSDALKRIREIFRDMIEGKKWESEAEGATTGFFSNLDGTALLIIFIMIVGLIVLILLVKLLASSRFGGGMKPMIISTEGTMENALKHSTPEWQSIAGMRAEDGDLRGAVRAMYLSLLVLLHRKNKILYRMEMTNWEYVRSMADRGTVREMFREITTFFDLCWYGTIEPDKRQFYKFEELVKRMQGAVDEK